MEGFNFKFGIGEITYTGGAGSPGQKVMAQSAATNKPVSIPAKKQAPVATVQAPATGIDPVYAKALQWGKYIHALLVAAGLGEPAASLGTYGSYHETGAFSSPLFLQHNNGSGIKFANQKGAVLGSNGYAWFATLQDWARAYAYELRKGANPAGATTIEDFAQRLKQNGYYTDSYDNYLHGLTRARMVLRAIPAAEFQYNPKEDYNPNTGISNKKPFDLQQWWNERQTIEKAGMIAGAAVLALVIVKS